VVTVVDGAVNLEPPGVPVLVADRYLLGRLLGRGGAAEVFRAHDQVLGHAVAVKIFLPGVAATDARRQHREIMTLAGFSHRSLVMVYNAGEHEGRAFFVMQLVEGRTLADRLREDPLPAAETAQLGIALADALAYVHGRGVIHRDVKPANVLLDQHGRPRLSDFGIAAVVDSTQITSTGMMIGTAAYLAPEQVRGHPVGPGADVYALGLVLLECLTGRREYPGSPMEAALARLHRRAEIPQGLPAPMTPLLEAMTAEDPAQRPTAADVVAWLQDDAAPIEGLTAVIAAPPPPPVEPVVAAPWWSRSRALLLAGALLAALAASFLLGLLPLSSTPTAVPKPGVSLPSAVPAGPALIPTTPDTANPSASAAPQQPAVPAGPALIPTTPDTANPSASAAPQQPAVPAGPALIPTTPDTANPSASAAPQQPAVPASTVIPTSPPAAPPAPPNPPPKPTKDRTPPGVPPHAGDPPAAKKGA